MPTLKIETQIDAPAEVCFDLMRDERLHNGTRMTVLTKGDMDVGAVHLGQIVAFESKFLGFQQRLVVKVLRCERPRIFVDEMIEGTFKTFAHIHQFNEGEGHTIILDTLTWTSPLGLIGKAADEMLIKSRLKHVVRSRNAALRQIVEGRQ